MAEKETRSGPAADLRKQAEEIVRGKTSQSPESLEAMSPEETRQTLHELRVHQIELSMQNEELRRTQAELDAAQTRYFDLYDLAPVGYCTLSQEGVILESNLTSSSLLGVARGALAKRPLSRFILKEDQTIYFLLRKQLIETGKPQACELRMVKKDGADFWAYLAMTAAQDENGAPVCRIVLSDITERKQAEEEKAKLEIQLLQTHKMEAIGTLAGGIAHDFNNILAAMIGYTELALVEDQKEIQHQYLQETLKGAERAKDLVKQILTFSRQDSREKKPLDMKLLLKEAVSFCGHPCRLPSSSGSTLPANPAIFWQTTPKCIRLS